MTEIPDDRPIPQEDIPLCRDDECCEHGDVATGWCHTEQCCVCS